MTKKFILVIPNATAAQQLAVKNLYPPDRAAWWHWSSDVFLVSFGQETPTAMDVRAELRPIFPNTSYVVFDIPETSSWAGWGSNGWQEWFDKYWKTTGG